MKDSRYCRFTVLISKLCRLIHKIKEHEMAGLGLKATHLTCLFYIYNADGDITATDICDISGEDKSAVSRAVHELESMGYIEQSGGERKKYRAVLTMTGKGEEIGEYINEKIDKIMGLGSEKMSNSERTKFYKMLELVNGNLQKICDSYSIKKTTDK